MDFFKILKGGVGVGMSNFDRLFAEKHGGGAWQLTTLTGTLPLSFKSKGSPLTGYKLYGTSEGAGVETENLWDESWVNGAYSYTGAFNNNPNVIASDPNKPIPVQGGTTYYIKQFKNTSKSEVFFYSKATGGFIRYYTIDPDVSNSFVTPQSATYMRFDCYRRYGNVYANDIVISTAFPTAYAPYGYKLPMTVESGEESTDTPIYIGDSKLMAEEYVDYESGKVWKLRDNLFDAEQIVEDSVSTASTYIKDGWLRYNTGPNPITINVDGQVGETFQFKLWAKNFNTTLQNNIRFILEYEDGTTVITGSNSFAVGTERYVQFTSNSAKALKRVISQNTSNRSAGIEISKTLIVKSDTMPETYLQPTDPPVALPELSTYQSENTLSCSEGLGEISITGYIKGE